MQISELMTKRVRTCRMDERCSTAAKLMWDGDCGDVPVVDPHDRLCGIITDRDICMAALHQGLPISDIPVASAMASRVAACSPTDSVSAALEIMRERRVRRIPVVDADRRVVGVLSQGDLVVAASLPGARKEAELTPDNIIRALASISTQRREAHA